MKKFITLAALFIATSISQADVLIYRGTLKSKASTEAGYPSVAGIYLIVEPASNTCKSILFFREGAKKRQFLGDFQNGRFSTAAMSQGKTASLISFAEASGSSNDDYSNNMTYFRGVNKTIRTNTVNLTQSINYPASFAGILLGAYTTGNTSQFMELKVTIVYQQKSSIDANNAMKTVTNVIEQISEELENKGYEGPVQP